MTVSTEIDGIYNSTETESIFTITPNRMSDHEIENILSNSDRSEGVATLRLSLTRQIDRG